MCVCACARAAEGTDDKRPLEAARALMTSNLSKQALGRFGGARYSGPLSVAVLIYQCSILRMRAFLAVVAHNMAAARLVSLLCDLLWQLRFTLRPLLTPSLYVLKALLVVS